MPVVWSPLVLVGALLTLSTKVMELAASAKRYRKNCQLLQDRVRMIANHLGELQQQQQGTSSDSSPAAQETMRCLRDVLERAKVLVESCQRKKKAFDFLRAHKKTNEFAFLGKRITNIMECFHMANRSLIQGLYGDRIFMVLLKTLLQDYDGRRVLQNNRRRVEIAMSGLTYSNTNVSPEKQEILRLIEEAMGPGWRQRYAAKPASYNERVQQIANIARDIVLKVEAKSHSKSEVERVAQLARQVLYFLPHLLKVEAKSHSKSEVERVAQLAQQVLYFLPHLQTPQLTQHPETAGLVQRLWGDLYAAHEAIVFGGAGGAAVMTSEHAKKICRIGNSLEQGYQRLTFIAMHQILKNNA